MTCSVRREGWLRDDAAAGSDDASGKHEIVVQFERLDRHAIGIFVFPCRTHAHGAVTEGGDAIEKRPTIVGVEGRASVVI